MCKFYSAIVMENGDLLHNENLMSHEDIIDLFDVNDSPACCGKFIRVEFTPDEESDFGDIKKYQLRVDESIIPDWWENHREYTESRLRDIVKKRIITGNIKLLTGGLYVVSNAKIDRIKSAIVVFIQNSQVGMMRENSQVNEMWGNSQVNEMWGNSQVNVMRDNSRANVMWGNSTLNEMWGNSQVNVMRDNSRVNEMRGNSQVNANHSKNKLPKK